jgi:DNA (cytosine-5)-methyltransferase 1
MVAFTQNQEGDLRESDVFGSVTTGCGMASARNAPMLRTGYAVRRLTPIECERLQGFPDNYTNIPWRKKPEAPDGPRYKALGNSWAVPVVRWIGERIHNAVD